MIADRTRSHHAFSTPEIARGGAHENLTGMYSVCPTAVPNGLTDDGNKRMFDTFARERSK